MNYLFFCFALMVANVCFGQDTVSFKEIPMRYLSGQTKDVVVLSNEEAYNEFVKEQKELKLQVPPALDFSKQAYVFFYTTAGGCRVVDETNVKQLYDQDGSIEIVCTVKVIGTQCRKLNLVSKSYIVDKAFFQQSIKASFNHIKERSRN